MSESDKDLNSDDWFDGLTDEEYAELRKITTPRERKIIIECAQKEGDEKCHHKIKNILRDMKRRGVNLDLIMKYTWQSLEERLHHEKVADLINEVKREAMGIKRKKGKKTMRKTHRKTRRTHKKTRRHH